jgi:hypothetical protein
MEAVRITPGNVSSDSVFERLKKKENQASGSLVSLCAQAQSLLCMGAVAIPALVIIAVDKLAVEKTPNTAQEKAAIEKALGQPSIQYTLRDGIVRSARDLAGQPIEMLDSEAQVDTDTILNIESLEFGLIDGIRPDLSEGLTFYVTTHVRVIEQATKREVYAAQIEHLGRTMPLAVWGANDAQNIREEFDLASHELAVKIVDTLFLLHRFTGPDLG